MSRRCAIVILLLLAVGVPAACSAAAKDVLDNGLVVITSPGGGSLAAVEVLLKAGALEEPAGKAGLRQLVQQTLVRGSEHMSGDELAAALDDLGADLDTGLGLDYVEAFLVCMGPDLGRAMELLAEIVRHPSFLQSEVEHEREVARSHLGSLRIEPFELAQLEARRGLYEGHPYGAATQGDERSLAALTRQDLADFHRRFYLPNNTIIAVAGAVSREEALSAVRRCFGDWQPGELPPRTAGEVPRLDHSTLQVQEAAVGQVYFALAYGVGAPRADSYPVMEVMCALLGGGMGSRLYGAVRANAALAYETAAYHYALTAGGYLAAYAAAAPTELERTKRLIVGEFERLRREPVGAAEMGRAQQFAMGADALAHQRIKDRAFRLAWCEAIGLGCGFDEGYAAAIASVTAEQIQAAARRWFDHYSLGLVMPSEQACAASERVCSRHPPNCEEDFRLLTQKLEIPGK